MMMMFLAFLEYFMKPIKTSLRFYVSIYESGHVDFHFQPLVLSGTECASSSSVVRQTNQIGPLGSTHAEISPDKINNIKFEWPFYQILVDFSLRYLLPYDYETPFNLGYRSICAGATADGADFQFPYNYILNTFPGWHIYIHTLGPFRHPTKICVAF